nr:MAG TPA: hypothetical protein [Caudoviricetes sp.]
MVRTQTPSKSAAEVPRRMFLRNTSGILTSKRYFSN